MEKHEEYLLLLSKTYDEAVKFLLEKYGSAKDDYFREHSYARFLNGEIKNITRGKFSRAFEGLECHHIDENKFLNMTNKDYIIAQKIPYKYHKKERLVFCDVIEHAILHTLIAKETSLEFGYPGYIVFLKPKIEEWYLNKVIPQKSKWHIACYHKAYITETEAIKLLEKMDNLLLTEQERINQREIERKKKIIQKGAYKYLNRNSSRHEIVNAMYELNKVGASGYLHVFNSFDFSEEHQKRVLRTVEYTDFEKKMQHYDLDGILKNIQVSIEFIEGRISHQDYLSQLHLFSKTIEEVRTEQKIQLENEKQEKLRREKFYAAYPKFEKIGIEPHIERQEVNALLYRLSGKNISFIKFQSEMKSYNLDELLRELHFIIKEG